MGLPLAEAAYGAHLIAASNMMRAIRAVSSERGRDPREYALFAFGGNGPLRGGDGASPGDDARGDPAGARLFSASACSTPRSAPLRAHVARRTRGLTRPNCRVSDDSRPRHAPSWPPRASAARGEHRALADCRYQGQSFELTVPVTPAWRSRKVRPRARADLWASCRSRRAGRDREPPGRWPRTRRSRSCGLRTAPHVAPLPRRRSVAFTWRSGRMADDAHPLARRSRHAARGPR